jgi:arylsulfatase A-like enzyme
VAPLIVSVPWIEGGARTDALTEFVDIYPTLCQLANLPVPQHVEGRSFVPLLRDPRRPGKKAIYSRYFNGQSVRTDRYCYTEWAKGSAKPHARMLYDHKLDPDENVNVAERPENAALVKELSGVLHRFRAGYRP